MKGIYAYWDNTLSQYVYIGKDSHIDKNRRHYAHLDSSRYDAQPFNRVIQNNPDRYEYRILMKGNYNEKQLNKMEQFCIKHLKTYHYDYPERHVFNFTKGGDGSTGYKPSPETCKKISESISGEKHPYYDKHHSEETKIKISKAQNTSGYLNVYKVKSKNCKQGFFWQYSYYENGKRKTISSVDIKKLEEKVKVKGLKWLKFEED